jgi:hypothetical protein
MGRLTREFITFGPLHQSVHKKLEREIFSKPVQIDIRSEEEYWAMRYIFSLTVPMNS